MLGEPKVLIPEESDLAKALDAATSDGCTLVVAAGSATYRLTVERLSPPTPEEVARSIEGIRRAAGSWAHVDAEALKAAIRRQRREGSRPSKRL